jgi:hypothetical protein
MGLSHESREELKNGDSFGVGKLAIRGIDRKPVIRRHCLQWQQGRKAIDASRPGKIVWQRGTPALFGG